MATPTFKKLIYRLGGAGLDVWRRRLGLGDEQTAIDLCHRLVGLRGEASAIVIADEIISRFNAMNDDDALQFFEQLVDHFQPDSESLKIAAEFYLAEPGPEAASALSDAALAPRQSVFRLLSTSPAGVPALVKLRERLLSFLPANPQLQPLDSDLMHLFLSWFNRGFLELRRIDWQTPAHILEKLIAYEAVHEIRGWDDLRRRLAEDRRCFAFFHPALQDEPLVFVQVALTQETATVIGDIIDEELSEELEPPKTAIFYSISNCQSGLRGVSFGNFLIKQVLLELKQEFPSVVNSLTLSPVPNFRRWLQSVLADPDLIETYGLSENRVTKLTELNQEINHSNAVDELLTDCKPALMRLCAAFLLYERRSGLPKDAVARFHLSNGASLDQVNWAGDLSARRLKQSFGILVNYLYEADKLEQNHEQLVNDGEIATSSTVRKLANGKHARRAA
ncbi:MAG: malonyl-CoA decarboxylase family protein [Pseudomonadota bacterium]